MVERQPGCHPVVIAQLGADLPNFAKIAQHGALGHLHPARKPGAAGRVLEIGGLIAAHRRQRLGGLRQCIEIRFATDKGQAQRLSGGLQQVHKAVRRHGHCGPAAFHHALNLAHIGVATAHLQGGGHGHGNQASVLTGKEEAMKQRIRVRNDGHPGVARQVEVGQTAGGGDGLLAELGIGHRGVQLAGAAVEVVAGLPPRRKVQRVSQPFEFSLRTWNSTARRGCAYVCQCSLNLVELSRDKGVQPTPIHPT